MTWVATPINLKYYPQRASEFVLANLSGGQIWHVLSKGAQHVGYSIMSVLGWIYLERTLNSGIASVVEPASDKIALLLRRLLTPISKPVVVVANRDRLPGHVPFGNA